MRKILYFISLLSIFSGFCVLTQTAFASSSSSSAKSGTSDKFIVQPNGEQSVGYPQISIRTNAKANPIDFNKFAATCDSIADSYPVNDPSDRSQAVKKYLLEQIGSGDLGHVWIIVFNSARPGDYVSYSYWKGSGYVSNHNKNYSGYDPSEREFLYQKDIKLPQNMNTTKIENELIPPLLKQSTNIGKILGIPEDITGNGTFTPVTTCSWFCGNLWNSINKLDNQVDFTSPFSNSSEHAKKWGMPFLADLNSFANPGALAKYLSK